MIAINLVKKQWVHIIRDELNLALNPWLGWGDTRSDMSILGHLKKRLIGELKLVDSIRHQRMSPLENVVTITLGDFQMRFLIKHRGGGGLIASVLACASLNNIELSEGEKKFYN